MKKVNINKQKKKDLILTIACFVFMLLCILFLRNVTVYDISMNPTLKEGDKLLLNLTYKTTGLKRFDIVIIKSGKSSLSLKYVKRIIGLPGETIEIKDNHTYIDGIVLSEDFIIGENPSLDMNNTKLILNENEYFVMGDNREYSFDSRTLKMGAINKKNIIGKVWIKVFPFPFKKF